MQDKRYDCIQKMLGALAHKNDRVTAQHSPSAAGLPSMAASVSVEDMVTDCLIFFTVLSAAKSELLPVRFIFSEDDRKIFLESDFCQRIFVTRESGF